MVAVALDVYDISQRPLSAAQLDHSGVGLFVLGYRSLWLSSNQRDLAYCQHSHILFCLSTAPGHDFCYY